ncbi:hypothetical protein [Bacillus thuringiensis]|uniref:Uncharacterized protein n=1 Tax=Bacillus thuringiensis TaxID=1428 RepID=A0A9X6Z5Q9_BACTU|nr:hypothetical protein [Bacillus thuringiensis]MEC3273863.1 hypothetical protein [Bacillus thuringiensis]PFB09044.1 hypothetical protein CN398_05235 [Bacillus thuringiensis]
MGWRFEVLLLPKTIKNEDLIQSTHQIFKDEPNIIMDSHILMVAPPSPDFYFKKISLDSIGNYESPVFTPREFALKLSNVIRNEDFIIANYCDGTAQGLISHFRNGCLVQKIESPELDKLEIGRQLLTATLHFPASESILSSIDSYFSFLHERNPYSLISYAHLHFSSVSEKRPMRRALYEQVQALIQNPNVTDEELGTLKGSHSFPPSIVRPYYQRYIMESNKNIALEKMYLFTNGFEGDATLKDAPTYLSPNNYFQLTSDYRNLTI